MASGLLALPRAANVIAQRSSIYYTSKEDINEHIQNRQGRHRCCHRPHRRSGGFCGTEHRLGLWYVAIVRHLLRLLNTRASASNRGSAPCTDRYQRREEGRSSHTRNTWRETEETTGSPAAARHRSNAMDTEYDEEWINDEIWAELADENEEPE